ncbi:MAG: hypothetical protein AAB017_03025 [Nitrospirota bacterium]
MMKKNIYKKIALIGTSAAGKTSCVLELGIDSQKADMDRCLGASIPQSMETMLKWILQSESNIVNVSVHIDALEKMASVKQGQIQCELSEIFFIHLAAPVNVIEERLLSQSTRSETNIKHTLAGFARTDDVCKRLADCTINTVGMGLQEVAHAVRLIAVNVRND